MLNFRSFFIPSSPKFSLTWSVRGKSRANHILSGVEFSPSRELSTTKWCNGMRVANYIVIWHSVNVAFHIRVITIITQVRHIKDNFSGLFVFRSLTSKVSVSFHTGSIDSLHDVSFLEGPFFLSTDFRCYLFLLRTLHRSDFPFKSPKQWTLREQLWRHKYCRFFLAFQFQLHLHSWCFRIWNMQSRINTLKSSPKYGAQFVNVHLIHFVDKCYVQSTKKLRRN